MTFRFKSKSLFLTYPQCDTPLETFFEKLKSKFGENIEKGVCSQETHQDGNKHLHAAIAMKKAIQTTNSRFFDDLVVPPKHPNINSRFKGGTMKAFQYVIKEGTYKVLPDSTQFDLQTFMSLAQKKKNTQASLIVKEFEKGSTIDEIAELYPEYMLLHHQTVQSFGAFLELKEKRKRFAENQEKKVFVKPAPGFSSSWNQEIALWLLTNIRKPRAHRQKQLWIKAPPEAGKTTLIMSIEETFGLEIYYWSKDEKWWDGYSDKAFDLIVIDEFNAQKTITELNQILSGDPIPLSRRNAPPILKRDKLPVIILSNFAPHECYKNSTAQQLAPLHSRIDFVEVPEGGKIRLIHDTQLESSSQPPLADDDDDDGSTQEVDIEVLSESDDDPLTPLAPKPALARMPAQYAMRPCPESDDEEGWAEYIKNYALDPSAKEQEQEFNLLNQGGMKPLVYRNHKSKPDAERVPLKKKNRKLCKSKTLRQIAPISNHFNKIK